jgi:RimJ/RimL family protein N-acetyltransferase
MRSGTKFRVVQTDISRYKEWILRMWAENLPGTPPGRFEWINHGDPAGEAVWFFAFEEASGDPVGTVSIMPRDVFLNRKKARAGILGDIMVQSKHRGLGVGLRLVRATVEHMAELGLEFVYSIPNEASRKTMERAGLRGIGMLQTMVRPIRAEYYLEKHLNPIIAKAVSAIADQAMKLISRETYVRPKGVFEELRSFDEAFGRFWERKIAEDADGAIGDRRPSYLTWRYLKNPEHDFRVIMFKRDGDRDLEGYLVFCIDFGKMRIYDIFALEEEAVEALLKRAVTLAREEKCHGIYVEVFERNPLVKDLKLFRFMDTKDDARILALGCDQLMNGEWLFFAGDRNI